MTFIKNFIDWFNLKPKIDNTNRIPPFVEEGHFWWAYIGENIGGEISGKGVNFARPIVVYKKLSIYSFMIIPCSTKIKEGNWFVQFVHNKKEQIAVLSQARVIDYRRLKNKIGEIDETDFERISSGFKELYAK